MQLDEFRNTTNLIGGGIVTVATILLGTYWYLFAGLLVLNLIDYLSGSAKARFLNQESSKKGAIGIVKKVWYWVVICIAFFISYAFNDLGKLLHIDLGFSVLLGYLTLACYIINEIRSILENIVAFDTDNKIPSFLTKGLEQAGKTIEEIGGKKNDN